MKKEEILILYGLAWIIMSLITYVLYYLDKKRAIKKQWRTPETTLLMTSFLLGSVGGLFGLYQIRHKNKHWYFVVINWGSFMLHIGIFIYFAAFYQNVTV